jgi:uncharacterized protein (UPF0276 family)
VDGFPYVEDDHTTAVLPDTWEIVSHVVARAPNLKAVVLECERNTNAAVAPLFTELERILGAAGWPVRGCDT